MDLLKSAMNSGDFFGKSQHTEVQRVDIINPVTEQGVHERVGHGCHPPWKGLYLVLTEVAWPFSL